MTWPGFWRSGRHARRSEGGLRKFSPDIRAGEIRAFEEQRFIGEFRQGVGEALAEVEAGGVAALACVAVRQVS